MGVGVGVTADDDRGCYDPVGPRFSPVLVVFLSKLNSKLQSVFVEIKSFEVPVFEITYLYHIDDGDQSKQVWLNINKIVAGRRRRLNWREHLKKRSKWHIKKHKTTHLIKREDMLQFSAIKLFTAG